MSVALSDTMITRHGVLNGVLITPLSPLRSGVSHEVNVRVASSRLRCIAG